MRAHRKRRREGSFIVRVQLDQPDIDGFVRLKLLQPGQRQDCRGYGKARPRFYPRRTNVAPRAFVSLRGHRQSWDNPLGFASRGFPIAFEVTEYWLETISQEGTENGKRELH
jgi:hypothetical protein